jgi:nitrate/nitrite-specific signal transduction histidine kinase
MKKLLAGLGFAVLALGFDATTHDAQAQIANINEAINKAGRQRMLSQRMAKAYLQIGQAIDGERSKKILDASIALFDRQLVELKNFAPTPEIKNTYLDLERAWLGYKDVLVGTRPNPEGARKVMEISEEVLALAHQGTVQLEKHSGTTQGRLVNIAGRQRMLSQRMAKFYQAINWGVAPANGKAEMERARKEFMEGLKELESASINTQAIQDALALGRQQWMFFENALLDRGGDKKVAALNVATTSERILEVMNDVTGMYETLQAKR